MNHTPRQTSVERLRAALQGYEPNTIELAGGMRQAAIAAIVREPRAGAPEMLFIRRAERPSDPWSGHMALPGGRVDPEDASSFHAALRETCEEVHIDLDRFATPIGALSHRRAMAHGRWVDLVIVPFVFELSLEAPEPRPDHEEVEEAVWVPLSFLLDPSERTTITRRYLDLDLTLPCYYYGERMIWGLTLRVVDELLRLA